MFGSNPFPFVFEGFRAAQVTLVLTGRLAPDGFMSFSAGSFLFCTPIMAGEAP